MESHLATCVQDLVHSSIANCGGGRWEVGTAWRRERDRRCDGRRSGNLDRRTQGPHRDIQQAACRLWWVGVQCLDAVNTSVLEYCVGGSLQGLRGASEAYSYSIQQLSVLEGTERLFPSGFVSVVLGCPEGPERSASGGLYSVLRAGRVSWTKTLGVPLRSG